MGAAAVFENPNSITRPISPCRELGAYEALWTEQGSSFRLIAERLGSISSDFVPEDEAFRYAATVRQTLSKAGVERFGIRVHGVWPENSIRRIPSSTKGYISVRNFGICEPVSVLETPRIKQETPKSWTRRIPPARQPFMTDTSVAAVTTTRGQAAAR